MKQKAFKEQVFKLLFRAEFNTKEELLEQLPFYFEAGDLTVDETDRRRIEERLIAILDALPEIDAQIASRLRNWRPERIGKVELAVIRMTVYELQQKPDVPVGVAINDAVEIAKKFGQDGAGQFVNGVLASFVPGQSADQAET
ncbi:MAG: transcription antitermination factor NusB [Eubacteriales bacterium]|nr:transcription antitermination factor NusB [Eubacteriales bacterium]